jgi:centrin-1
MNAKNTNKRNRSALTEEQR